MVKKTALPRQTEDNNRKRILTMTIQTDIKFNWTTHNPTRKDLIFAPPAFFCFSAYAQLAHLALPDTQTDPSQSQKSQFFPTHRQNQGITSKTFIQ